MPFAFRALNMQPEFVKGIPMPKTIAKKTWFRAQAAGEGVADISIFSEIGGFGVTVQSFHDALKALGTPDEIRLAISSNGGDISTGFAVYNMLDRHPARKIVTVEGLAASMGSVIAMVGDEVIMPSNAMLMIHNPFGMVAGGAAEIESFGQALAKMRVNIADAYKARTGMSRGEVLAMMNKETWLSAKEAVEKKFADRVEKAVAVNGRFDVSNFTNVPAVFGRITRSSAMAKKPVTEFEDGEDEIDPVKTRAEVRKEVLAEQAEIRALCKLAGCKPEATEVFISENKTRAEVMAALEAEREENAKKEAAKLAKGKGKDGKEATGTETSARHVPGTGGGEAPTIDTAKIYAKFNAAGRNAA